MISPYKPDVDYAAQGKLLDLVEAACITNKRLRREQYFNQAAQILYLLEVSTLYDGYLEDTQVNNIVEALKIAADLYDYPVSPGVNQLSPPVVNIGPQGEQGEQGEPGLDGGAFNFTSINATSNTVVDSFEYSAANGARWDVLINGTAQRASSIWATWTEDGLSIDDSGEVGTPDVNGSTSGISLTVTIFGTQVRLNAIITSGTWTITGSRYFIPTNGAGVGQITNSLPDGQVYIGNSSNIATARSVSGDISITNTGVVSITPLAIVNGDISSSAAIATSKLAAMTASRGVVTDASGFLTTSAATSTEVGYLSGVTSNIQTQLDSKLSAASGAISTVVSTNLTPDRVVISDPSGKIAVAGASSTEVSYLIGVTSAIQTQINTKITAVGVTLNTKVVQIGDWNMDSTATVNVAHGLGVNFIKIRTIGVIIIQDDSTKIYDLFVTQTTPATLKSGQVDEVNSTNIVLRRIDFASGGTLFDSTAFDSTGFNRGWVTITYET